MSDVNVMRTWPAGRAVRINVVKAHPFEAVVEHVTKHKPNGPGGMFKPRVWRSAGRSMRWLVQT